MKIRQRWNDWTETAGLRKSPVSSPAPLPFLPPDHSFCHFVSALPPETKSSLWVYSDALIRMTREITHWLLSLKPTIPPRPFRMELPPYTSSLCKEQFSRNHKDKFIILPWSLPNIPKTSRWQKKYSKSSLYPLKCLIIHSWSINNYLLINFPK